MTNPRIGMLAGLIDSSSSMLPYREMVVESIEALLKEQASLVKDGELEDVYCYLAQFSSYTPQGADRTTLSNIERKANEIHSIYKFQGPSLSLTGGGYKILVDMDTLDWAELPDISNYQPHGTTALYDGIMTLINDVGLRLSGMREEDRPGTVIVFINTDGMDNDSHYHTVQQVKDRIQHQESTYNWKFIFATSNLEAAKEASQKMGVRDVLSYDTENTREVYGTMSKTLLSTYRMSTAGVKND